jgi:hypothetical protein
MLAEVLHFMPKNICFVIAILVVSGCGVAVRPDGGGGWVIQPQSVAHAAAVGDPIAGSLAAVLCPWLPPGDGSTAPHGAISAVFTGDTVLAVHRSRRRQTLVRSTA